MITATNDGITLATTTGTDAEVQDALGSREALIAPTPAPDAPAVPPESVAEGQRGPESEAGGSPPGPPASPEPVPEAPAEAPPDAPPAKDRSYQSRINRLTWERAQAEQRATELEAALAARAAVPPAPPPPADVSGYDSYEAWVEARATQIAEEKVTALRVRVEAAEAERTRVEALARYRDRVDEVRNEFPDYDAWMEQSKDITISAPLVDYIRTAADGPRLAYYLAQHHEDAARLSDLPPSESNITLGIEIGKVLARQERVTTGPPPAAVPRSAAPTPIKPVGGGASAAAVPLDQLDFQAYKRLRDRQEEEWRASRR